MIVMQNLFLYAYASGNSKQRIHDTIVDKNKNDSSSIDSFSFKKTKPGKKIHIVEEEGVRRFRIEEEEAGVNSSASTKKRKKKSVNDKV